MIKENLLIHVKTLQKRYDSEAFRTLHDRLSLELYRLIMRYIKDSELAKDVLQDVLVTIYEKIKKFKNKGSFEGWCKKIAIYQCLTILKEKKATNLFAEEFTVEEEKEEAEFNDFDKNVSDDSLNKTVKLALNRLPKGYCTILKLNVIEGYAHKEIASIMGISEGTSRSQTKRAKDKLKELLNENLVHAS